MLVGDQETCSPSSRFVSGDEFCKASPPAQQQPPLEFNGGLTGVDENLFAYYILSLYWPPSSCPLKYNETDDLSAYFCSPFTDEHQPGRERLALHGLWPTFFTGGNYQGWPQFCVGKQVDWSRCHIDGNLCPWTNTSQATFSQSMYEYCLATENMQQCLVNGVDILEPERERLAILAPGYLNRLNLFINHEWTKHGSSSLTQLSIAASRRCLSRLVLFVGIWKQYLQLSDAYARSR